MQDHFGAKRIYATILSLTVVLLATVANAADSNLVSVTATVISRGNCTFRSRTSTLSFGTLDPVTPVDKSVSTTLIYRCQAQGNAPITFAIMDDDGLYEAGPNAPRMRHTTQLTEYLPYRLTLNPTSGTAPKTVEQTLTVTGTVRGVDYQDALAGAYSDSVVITIEP
jgi:spore coat protein U-like protein